MSAESELSAILGHATAAASSLSASSQALVTAAIVSIQQDVDLPTPQVRPHDSGISFPGPNDSGISFPGSTTVLPPPQPQFPVWPGLSLGTPPNLQDLDTITAKFTKEFPDLNLPTFKYPEIAGLARFSAAVPVIDTAVAMPPLPTLEPGFNPDRMDSLPITTPTLTLPDTQFLPINTTISFDPTVFDNAYRQFRTAIFGGIGGVPGLDELLADLRALSAPALDVLLPALMELARSRLTDRYAPVLTYHTALQQRLQDRLNEERDRLLAAAVDQDRSGWALPDAVRAALRATAEQVAHSWQANALSQHDTKTMELALAFFESVGDLFTNLYDGYLALRKSEIEQVLEAHRLSLAYAKQSIAALLAVYEANQFTRQEMEQKKAEAKLAVFEAELKLAMTRYQLAQAQLEAEQGRLDNDSNLIKLYQSDLQKAELDVKLFAAQVATSRSEVEALGLPQEVFMLQVRAFDALVNAYESRIRAYLAEVNKDSALVEAELTKVKAFEAEARAFMSVISAKSQLSEAQDGRNQQVIKEFEAAVKIEMAGTEYSAMKDKHALAVYEVALEDVLADAKIAMRKLSVDLDYENRKTESEQKALDLTNERSLELMKTELNRLQSIAEVNSRGAGIMASMAEGAMSAANGIAGAIFEES